MERNEQQDAWVRDTCQSVLLLEDAVIAAFIFNTHNDKQQPYRATGVRCGASALTAKTVVDVDGGDARRSGCERAEQRADAS